MIKKILLIAALIVPALMMSAPSASAQAGAMKFGTVKVQQIMEALPDYAEMKSAIEASSKTYEDEFALLQQEMENKYTEFQKMGADTPDSIKERRMQELQELDQKIQQFRQTAQQDLQRMQMQKMQPIQEKIMKAIQTVGASGNYVFIFDSEQSYYAGPMVEDVTDAVKSALGVK